MPVTLTIRNEVLGPASVDHSYEWDFSEERITVRELIRRWVYEQVDDRNRVLRDAPNSPGCRSTELDWRREFEVATRAYEQQRILVLVGARQTGSLDEVVVLSPGTEITFLQLTEIVAR